MSKRHPFLVVLQAAVLACGVVFAAHAAEENKPGARDVIFKGDAKCTGCHDENDNAPVFAIGKTKHGVAADGRNIGCVGCHGESKLHAENPQGLKDRPKVDRGFLKNTTTPVEERNAACLGCHEGGNRMHWASSQHASSDIACTSCHQVHTQHDKVRDKAKQGEVCFECHKQQRAESLRASHHPIKEGKVACSNCHNPHGSTGPKLLARNTVVETCYTCHAEKRGPFLWEHPPAGDNCLNCHSPHGSNHPTLLKAKPPYLCQQCHDWNQHPGNVYSGAQLPAAVGVAGNAGQQLVLRACLNCHTQVHGSNHPSGSRNTR
ncbi:MAG: DmsE family decaheme c-type cytochrome [Rhodocyclaceae bacterium]|nr:DmsE family decaheme c-type cytochrome [Rhodocyclaceae bacterium]